MQTAPPAWQSRKRQGRSTRPSSRQQGKECLRYLPQQPSTAIASSQNKARALWRPPLVLCQEIAQLLQLPLRRCHPVASQSLCEPHALVILFPGQSLPIKFQEHYRNCSPAASECYWALTLHFIVLYSILQALNNQQLFQVVKFNYLILQILNQTQRG